MKLIVICAWCGKFIGSKDLSEEQTSDKPISHGICESCAKKILEELPYMKVENKQ